MSTETSTPWWDEEDHDEVTGDTWRTKRIHVDHRRPDVLITETTDHLGHRYVEVDVPPLPSATLVETRLLRVALDRAIRLADRLTREALNQTTPATTWSLPTVEPTDIYATGREDGRSMYE